MALTTYKKKRSFKDTPEPTGGRASGKALRFVIQKHDASRLHYDFRLEMNGVLKSWAVPKGPSTNPEDKRLAMMVEDHPYDYRNFEGIIPEGNYGAGTVIVWDEGTYEPLEPSGDKDKDSKALLKQLKSGSLKVRLYGHKLQGEFALVRLKNAENNAWLLIKHRDEFAKPTDVTRKVRSVISDKTIEEVEKASDHIYGQKKSAKSASAKKTSTPAKRAAPKKSSSTSKGTTARKTAATKATSTRQRAASPVKHSNTKPAPVKAARKKKAVSVLAQAPKAAFPKHIKPMLGTLVSEPFDQPGWLYEIKWDGYRALALSHKGKVELLSRNQKSFNDKFYPVYEAVKAWEINAVIDGEICVVNEKGIAHFGSLQNWRSEADGELVYYVFDILWLDGHDLTELPLTERRALLQALVPAEGIIRYSDNFESNATEFLAVAARMGMEGVMAKKADSLYVPGERTRDWLKLKANKRHEVVIGGYTRNDDSPKLFSALLVGVYEGSRLHYTGKIGTGFNDKLQREMMQKFKRLSTTRCPFTDTPDVNKPSRFRPNPPHATVTWLKPELVGEVSYAELTSDGIMRHPSFEGMREDKKARSVTAEKALDVKAVTKKGKKNPASKLLTKGGKPDRRSLLNPSEATQVKEIDGHELSFTNLDKVFWPKEKYTKRDMLNYYYQVAPYILPYLINRPQSLNRYPNGIKGKSFYQKDVTGKAPGWIKQFPYRTSEGDNKNFMVPTNEAGLMWMANLGSIEMNPWNSTIDTPDHPDWCCLDLDPDKGNTFEQVVQTARMVKRVLDELGIEGYPKTSGSTGIHVYIPLGVRYTYDECQLFGKLIATRVQEQLPSFTSIERLTRNRKGMLYIDYLQNRPKATLAAAYSLRPKPGATVSMPLEWSEVKKGLQMEKFTISNAITRIKHTGDLFKPVLGKGVNIERALKQLT
ncbi:DNA ligase D [Paraflavitalea sp. CAU 1676]|uniref:DNA ligase D n=1 Tax=Paraflavitalea sp. CAU 1676 TaxID=3032598 RepID=UPI0023D9DA44|nr:DNA ligase D [Paraflavitalea sp. CAU 1676]MDF2193249.1 DNA ligase D [Paraflavitalea sp. CAU 1676]